MTNTRTQLGLSLFLLWVGIALFTPLFAIDRDVQIDQLHHTAWTADNAAIGETKQIVQTSDGFLWIVTSDDRLLRFDGVRFEPIETALAGAIPTGEHRWDNVFTIEAVPDGGLWIGHGMPRVDLLKDGQVHTFSTQSCFPQGPINLLVQDHDGDVWIGTPQGLGRLQDSQCKAIGPGWGYSGGVPAAMFVDRSGTLWVKSQDGRLFFLRRGATAFAINASGSGDPKPTGAFAEAPDGSMWQVSMSGIQRILQGRDDRPGIRAPKLGPHVETIRILFDHEGALWIATEDGLHRIPDPAQLVPWRPKRGEKKSSNAQTPSKQSGDSSQTFTIDQGLSSNVIWDIFQDREGSIWTATGAGLDRFRNNAFIQVPLHRNHQGQSTFAAGEHGTVWAAAWDSSLFNLGDRVLSAHPIEDENISALYRDPSGVIWVGTFGKSIWHSSGNGLVRAGWPPGVDRTYVRAMNMDHSGGLWVSLATGDIFRLADGVWTRENDRLGIPANNPVFGIATDDHGRVWFNTGIVYVLDGNGVEKLDKTRGVQRGYATLIQIKGTHTWLGGLYGLALFTNNHFQVIKGVDGEDFRVTTGIIELSDGDMWINTQSGVVRVPAAEVQKAIREPAYQVQFSRFDTLDGLEGKAAYWIPVPTAVAGLDGKLWFSTNKGVFWVDPEKIAKYRNFEPPPVLVEHISADNKTYDLIPAAKGYLRLPPRVRDLEIDYTALSFVAPEKVLFRFKLEGWDHDWQNVGNRRRAFFTNLPPGNYRFRVTACNDAGVWNEEGTFLDFSIAPAYYQTNWFRALCAAIFLAVLWALHRAHIQRLHGQEKKLRDVVETIPTFAWTALPDGSIDFINHHWVKFTGLSAKKTIGLGWQEAVHPEDLRRQTEKWQACMKSGEPFDSEVRYRGAEDGRYRWFLARAVPLRDARGKIVKWYGTSTDIEDHKRAEQLQAELAHVNRVSTLGEMAASLAHEIKQPITAAITSANSCIEWLAQEPPNLDRARAAAGRIDKYGNRAAEIIDHIRSFYRKSPPQRELVEVNEVIREMIELLRPQASQYEVSIRADLVAVLPKINADRVQLQQVLMNLIVNAIEAMKETGGVLTVNTQLAENGQLLISVRDNGMGLPAERPDQIFDVFFTTKPQGSGMGLSISRSIVESHGGCMWATANDGPGATFYFTLPTATETIQMPATGT